MPIENQQVIRSVEVNINIGKLATVHPAGKSQFQRITTPVHYQNTVDVPVIVYSRQLAHYRLTYRGRKYNEEVKPTVFKSILHSKSELNQVSNTKTGT